jgi:hypothetical protein
MNLVALIAAITQLITQLGGLALQAVTAAQANDQTTLDTIQASVVAASNALKPPGGIDAVGV